jgi:hypothetical protein
LFLFFIFGSLLFELLFEVSFILFHSFFAILFKLVQKDFFIIFVGFFFLRQASLGSYLKQQDFILNILLGHILNTFNLSSIISLDVHS